VSAAATGDVLEVAIAGRLVHVDAEGFMTDPGEWTPEIGAELAADLGLPLDEERLAVLRFVRDDYAQRGTTATLRRLKAVGGFETRRLFALFPQKPAKKIAYVAGVPKPAGCV
jgi:tRNA 2-thiouridine synthesizing protein E